MNLEKYLHKHIPISSAIGVKVDVASSERVVLSAPFLNNINHKQTVFGGSLHAVATLTCWSLLHINLVDLFKDSVQIVIASSEINYLTPVTSNFKAECLHPQINAWERFLTILRKKGKARLQLNARISENGQLCVDYSGIFVAIVNLD